jgi:hypothetical protein
MADNTGNLDLDVRLQRQQQDLEPLTLGYLVVFPSFPTASKEHRGRVAVKFNAAGVADEVKVCRKKTDDTYEWVDVTSAVQQTVFDAEFHATNGHKHTGVAGDGTKIGISGLDFDIATQAELDAHTTRSDNPHNVTAAQIGVATSITGTLTLAATTWSDYIVHNRGNQFPQVTIMDLMAADPRVPTSAASIEFTDENRLRIYNLQSFSYPLRYWIGY